MCNDFGNRVGYRDYVEAFSHIRLPMIRPGPAAAPNLEPRDEIWPTDAADIVRSVEGGVELLRMVWGWSPGRPKARVVINLRSEGRSFERGRCLVPASHYYEFTDPAPPEGATARKKAPKTRWRFSLNAADWFCFAGLVGKGEDGGEAFTLLTCAPGPDVEPYHDRQPVVLPRDTWSSWLAGSRPAEELLRPLPAGSLTVTEAPRSAAAGDAVQARLL